MWETCRKIPWRSSWQTTPVFLPGEPPWTEELSWLQSMGLQSDTTEWLSTAQVDIIYYFFLICIILHLFLQTVGYKHVVLNPELKKKSSQLCFIFSLFWWLFLCLGHWVFAINIITPILLIRSFSRTLYLTLYPLIHLVIEVL